MFNQPLFLMANLDVTTLQKPTLVTVGEAGVELFTYTEGEAELHAWLAEQKFFRPAEQPRPSWWFSRGAPPTPDPVVIEPTLLAHTEGVALDPTTSTMLCVLLALRPSITSILLYRGALRTAFPMPSPIATDAHVLMELALLHSQLHMLREYVSEGNGGATGLWIAERMPPWLEVDLRNTEKWLVLIQVVRGRFLEYTAFRDEYVRGLKGWPGSSQ